MSPYADPPTEPRPPADHAVESDHVHSLTDPLRELSHRPALRVLASVPPDMLPFSAIAPETWLVIAELQDDISDLVSSAIPPMCAKLASVPLLGCCRRFSADRPTDANAHPSGVPSHETDAA